MLTEDQQILLSEYSKKVNFYLQTNARVKGELDDSIINLDYKRKILLEVLSQKRPLLKAKNEIISELQNICSSKMKSFSDKFKTIYKIQCDSYIIHQEIENKTLEKDNTIMDIKEKIFFLNENLKEKLEDIDQLYLELNKYYIKFRPSSEIFVAEPDRCNSEINHELYCLKDVLEKLEILINERKIENNSLTMKLQENNKRSKSAEKDIREYYDSESSNDIELNSEEEIEITFPDKVEKVKLPSQRKSKSPNIPSKLKLNFTKVKEKYSRDNSQIKVIYCDKPSKEKQASLERENNKGKKKNSYSPKTENELAKLKNEIEGKNQSILQMTLQLENLKLESNKKKKKMIQLRQNLIIADSKIAKLKKSKKETELLLTQDLKDIVPKIPKASNKRHIKNFKDDLTVKEVPDTKKSTSNFSGKIEKEEMKNEKKLNINQLINLNNHRIDVNKLKELDAEENCKKS